MPRTLCATYSIVTPMFLGDAEQTAKAFRPTALKGCLRFWWRATRWGRIRNEHGSDRDALRALHAREARLFGSAAGDGSGPYTTQEHSLGP